MGSGVIAKGVKMKFKRTIPYMLFGISLLPSIGNTTPRVQNYNISNNTTQGQTIKISPELLAYADMPYNATMEYPINQSFIENRADLLCQNYLNHMMKAQQKLEPLIGQGARYHNAVRQELPGAPVGKHCVYGQYTQLGRALKDMGDTIKIIPYGARASCSEFKRLMRATYKNNDFYGCILEGQIYETDSAYYAAQQNFVKKHNAKMGDANYAELMEKFEKSNYSAEMLEPGTIMIVPRTRGSKNQFHAIVLLGKGKIENGKFTPDPDGKYVYTGHNRERLGYLFKSWDTRNVFSARINEIARVKYGCEFKKIESMPYEQLAKYVSEDSKYPAEQIIQLPHEALLHLAREKYFHICNPQEVIRQTQPILAADMRIQNIFQTNLQKTL